MSQTKRQQTDDQDSLWEDLVISILSVNQYSLEKTYPALPLLREGGLLNPENLSRWESAEIVARLKAAGCDRGPFMTELFASRLAFLGRDVNSRGIAVCSRILLSNDPTAISNLLLPVKGIGPKVLQNFFMLRGVEEEGKR
jgi:hypothetical protein